jgi:hypothetical protein
MANEEPTFWNLAKELFSRGYQGRAAHRRSTTKSAWDLIFLPIGFGAIGLFAFAFFRLFWWLHVLIYPPDATRLKMSLGGPISLGQFLMIVVPLFGAMPLGLAVSNCLMWLIASARGTSEKKAKGVKWASFGHAHTTLLKAAVVQVPITLAYGSIGAAILRR